MGFNNGFKITHLNKIYFVQLAFYLNTSSKIDFPREILFNDDIHEPGELDYVF